MKELMMNTIYNKIDEAQDRDDIMTAGGMIELFFIWINQHGITYEDYQQLQHAWFRKIEQLTREGVYQA